MIQIIKDNKSIICCTVMGAGIGYCLGNQECSEFAQAVAAKAIAAVPKIAAYAAGIPSLAARITPASAMVGLTSTALIVTVIGLGALFTVITLSIYLKKSTRRKDMSPARESETDNISVEKRMARHFESKISQMKERTEHLSSYGINRLADELNRASEYLECVQDAMHMQQNGIKEEKISIPAYLAVTVSSKELENWSRFLTERRQKIQKIFSESQ